jgi:hypothetical protein
MPSIVPRPPPTKMSEHHERWQVQAQRARLPDSLHGRADLKTPFPVYCGARDCVTAASSIVTEMHDASSRSALSVQTSVR